MELTITLPWAVFIACLIAFAGAGFTFVAQAILVAAKAHVCPEPEPHQCAAAPVEVVVPVPAAHPEPPRHPGMPEPSPLAEAHIFGDTVHDMFVSPDTSWRPWQLPAPEPVGNVDYRGKPHWDTWAGQPTGSFSLADLQALLDKDECEQSKTDAAVVPARQRFTKYKASKSSHMAGVA